MNEKRLNKIVAVVFLIVGVLASVNTFRLHTYINETLPRDQAQEQCQAELLGVLKGWVAGRYTRDATIDVRDDAVVAMLDELAAGNKPTPAEIQRWRDAVIADNQERMRGTQMYHELPDCTP